ncbi:hypothetical protein BFS13_09875 [Pantoea sp. Ae16]|nr:hypothetical protein BFS13_09875 [Pantoea sp. Ae16]
MLQAMAVIWPHAGVRKNKLLRLTTGYIAAQADDIVKDDGSIIPAGIRPTQLAASFVKADCVAHMMIVLIDLDPEAASLTGPTTYYDWVDSYCTNPFWSSCQHRMASIGCDFNLLKQSARGLMLESKVSVRRYFDEVPLTPDEREPSWKRTQIKLNRH